MQISDPTLLVIYTFPVVLFCREMVPKGAVQVASIEVGVGCIRIHLNCRNRAKLAFIKHVTSSVLYYVTRTISYRGVSNICKAHNAMEACWRNCIQLFRSKCTSSVQCSIP